MPRSLPGILQEPFRLGIYPPVNLLSFPMDGAPRPPIPLDTQDMLYMPQLTLCRFQHSCPVSGLPHYPPPHPRPLYRPGTFGHPTFQSLLKLSQLADSEESTYMLLYSCGSIIVQCVIFLLQFRLFYVVNNITARNGCKGRGDYICK